MSSWCPFFAWFFLSFFGFLKHLELGRYFLWLMKIGSIPSIIQSWWLVCIDSLTPTYIHNYGRVGLDLKICNSKLT